MILQLFAIGGGGRLFGYESRGIKEGDDIKDYYIKHNKIAVLWCEWLKLLITIVGGVTLGLMKKPFVMLGSKMKRK